MKLAKAAELRAGNVIRRPGEPDREVTYVDRMGDTVYVRWEYVQSTGTFWASPDQPVVLVEAPTDDPEVPDLEPEEIPTWLREGVPQ
jgi:hypothetical protein